MVGVLPEKPTRVWKNTAVRALRETAAEGLALHGAEVPITHEC